MGVRLLSLLTFLTACQLATQAVAQRMDPSNCRGRVPLYSPSNFSAPAPVRSTLLVPGSSIHSVAIDVIRGQRSGDVRYIPRPRPKYVPVDTESPRQSPGLLARESASSVLIQATEETPRARAAALWNLREASPGPDELALLQTRLRDSDPEVRRVAVRVAGRWGTPAAPCAQVALLDALSDDEPKVRAAAADALVELGHLTVPVLVEKLSADRETTREAASRALVELGSVSVEPLTESLASEKAPVRYWAAHSLGRIGSPAVGALERLRQLAKADPDSTVRYYAANAVRHLEQ